MTTQPTSKTLPEHILVSIATAPLLATLLGSKSMATLMAELGQLSEEIFRGDRLPLLPLQGDGQVVDED